MTEPPPPRYRVIEHGRRLEVIDSWTGAPVAPLPPGLARKTSAPRTMSGQRLHRGIALIACRGARTETGQPIFATVPAIDAKGPRDIVLGPVGIARLARTIVGIVVAVIVVLGIAASIWAGSVGAIVVALAFGASRVQPIATGWFDRLAALDGR